MFSHALRILLGFTIYLSTTPHSTASSTEAGTSDATIIRPTTQFSQAEKYEELPAGALTHHKKINHDAFSHPSANMSFERKLNFTVGDALFKKIWVSSPSSTQASDGLGPLFNARACQRCHIKDGRGHPPANNNDNRISMLIRLAIPPQNKEQQEALAKGAIAQIPDPIYGGQLQDHSVIGIHAEGEFTIHYTEKTLSLNGGETIQLRHPHYQLKHLHYGKPHQQVMLSPRIAPQMIGLGLLEAISAQDIEQQADPDDKDNDGISGKVQRVWSRESQQLMIGRFGHKAGQPTLNQQNQAAFNGDIGLSTPLFPNASGECTTHQTLCLSLPNGNSKQYSNLEADEQITDLVLHYTRNLAVPARRNVNNADVLAGKRLFYNSGCIDCHTPKYITPRKTNQPEQARQLIWPYTDLLLHDMGEGLADNSPEGRANGREWRTPPLWGIGLTPTINKHSFYLHDGRARNLLEAILWHGGEAKASQQYVINMSPIERKQLLQFVQSL